MRHILCSRRYCCPVSVRLLSDGVRVGGLGDKRQSGHLSLCGSVLPRLNIALYVCVLSC